MVTTTPPYRASWVDQLFDQIVALPGPAWVPYAAVGVVVGVGVNAAAWADGYIPAGTLDLYLSSHGVFIIAAFAAIQFLDYRATRAWTTFRPAASLAEDDADRVQFELTTMPARPVLGWTIMGLAGALLITVAGYGSPFEIEGEPLTFLVTTPVATIAYVGGALLIYHTIRQLRLIGQLPRYVDKIDLLDAGPLHAFSGVTALTGGIFLASAYLSALTDPATFTNPAVAAVNGVAIIIGVACFVLPLYGMQRRIAAEKALRLSAVGHHLDAALRDLARRNQTGDLSDADAVNKNIASLLAERDLIAHTPTWPWSPETLRGFSTALVLPIVLWLIFRVLERTLV